MNTTFAQLISPTGCYSTNLSGVSAQYAMQGYIRSTTGSAAQSLCSLRKRVAASGKIDPQLKAAAEVHVISYPHSPEVRVHRAYSQRFAAVELLKMLLLEVCHG